MRPDKSKIAYSIPELCEATTLGRSLIYQENKNGNLRIVKVGRRTIITIDEAKRYVRAKQAEAEK